MAGYIRQSSGQIVNNTVIDASHFNNEYNKLQDAFDATTGHTHGGGTGEGAPLPPTALSGVTADGILVRVSASTTTPRTLTGTANQITVTNGTGVSGNPTLTIPSAFTAPGSIASTSTITAATGLTVSAGGAAITGTTAVTGSFTTTTTLTAGTGLTVTTGGASITGNVYLNGAAAVADPDVRVVSVKGPNSGSGYGIVSVESGLNTKSGVVQISGADGDMDVGTQTTNTTGMLRLLSGGRTAATLSASGTLTIARSGGTLLSIEEEGVGSVQAIVFKSAGTQVGNLDITPTGVTLYSASDYRLKGDITPLENATSRVKQLQPKRYHFLVDPATIVDGFIAHEVAEVIPGAVSGVKDGEYEDGAPKYQSVDASKLVPLLTAALQEALLRIEVLEGKLN